MVSLKSGQSSHRLKRSCRMQWIDLDPAGIVSLLFNDGVALFSGAKVLLPHLCNKIPGKKD